MCQTAICTFPLPPSLVVTLVVVVVVLVVEMAVTALLTRTSARVVCVARSSEGRGLYILRRVQARCLLAQSTHASPSFTLKPRMAATKAAIFCSSVDVLGTERKL